MNSYRKYNEISQKLSSILCIGLDSSIEKLPITMERNLNGLLNFNRELISATKEIVPAYKINFAFYEEYGAAGFDILRKTIEFIPNENFIIADAKRGDIGNTSERYAKSVFNHFAADAITVNPYMGLDCIEPFLGFGKTVFILALTSNSGSDDFQRLESNGIPMYKHVINKTMKWGPVTEIGFVVGATHPEEFSEIRNTAEKNILLIPGIGAQGGSLKDIVTTNQKKPAIINVSRDIIFASGNSDFADKAREKAIYYNEQINNFI